MITALVELRRWLRKNFIGLDCDEVEIIIRFPDPNLKHRVREQIISEISSPFEFSDVKKPEISEIRTLLGFKVRFE